VPSDFVPTDRLVADILARAERALADYDFDREVEVEEGEATSSQRQRVEDLVDDYETKCRQRQYLLSEADDGCHAMTQHSSKEAVRMHSGAHSALPPHAQSVRSAD
jgi:hypothetical protein